MKKIAALLLCGLMLTLTACGASQSGNEPYSAQFTIRQTSAPTEVFFDKPTEAESVTHMAESPTNVLPSDSIDYNELYEFTFGILFTEERPHVTKWPGEVLYCIEGDYTQEDIAAMKSIAEDLGQISSFHGIRETQKDTANLQIVFTDDSVAKYSNKVDENGKVISAVIQIPSSASDTKKTSYLYKALFSVSGINGTAETTLDSMFSTTSPSSLPTEADWIIMDILYSSFTAGQERFYCQAKFKSYFQSKR